MSLILLHPSVTPIVSLGVTLPLQRSIPVAALKAIQKPLEAMTVRELRKVAPFFKVSIRDGDRVLRKHELRARLKAARRYWQAQHRLN